MPRQPSVVAVATGFLLAVAACSDNSQPTDPSTPPSTDSPNLSAAQGQPTNPMALLRGVRGFGGFFLDAQGNPTVYLKEQRGTTSREPRARAVAPGARAAARPQLRVRQGEFEWAQLERWFAQASPEVLCLSPARYSSTPTKRPTGSGSGLSAGHRMAQIRAASRAAWHSGRRSHRHAETEPIRQLATLRDAVRPTIGGLQINFDPDPATAGQFRLHARVQRVRGRAALVHHQLALHQRAGWTRGHASTGSRSVPPTRRDRDRSGRPRVLPPGLLSGSRICRFSDASRAPTRRALNRSSAPSPRRRGRMAAARRTIDSRHVPDHRRRSEHRVRDRAPFSTRSAARLAGRRDRSSSPVRTSVSSAAMLSSSARRSWRPGAPVVTAAHRCSRERTM